MKLKIIGLERLRNPGKAGIGSVLEHQFETVFKEALLKTKDPEDDTISFSVEDDGTGFDPKRELMKAASESGLGLATMSERVRVAGGILDLWSQEGKGTRITFSIPIEKGGA